MRDGKVGLKVYIAQNMTSYRSYHHYYSNTATRVIYDGTLELIDEARVHGERADDRHQTAERGAEDGKHQEELGGYAVGEVTDDESRLSL